MIKIWLLFVAVVVSLESSDIWTVSCNSNVSATDMLENINLDLTGKIILTTGGDGHIATQFNLALVKANATVILACYNADKCTKTAATLISQTGMPAARVETELLDLSSKEKIRAMAANVTARHNATGLYALVNSAGSYSTRISVDGYVDAMEISLLGHALLTDLLLPLLRGNAEREKGRIVNVAEAVYGTQLLAPNNTVEYLTNVTKGLDAYVNATNGYSGLAKYLFIHHASELALREKQVIAMSINPGYAIEVAGIPQKLLKDLPKWLKSVFPSVWKIHEACSTNFKGLGACPELYEQSAAVWVVASVWPNTDAHSGSYLDFDTTILPPTAPHVFGLW